MKIYLVYRLVYRVTGNKRKTIANEGHHLDVFILNAVKGR